MTALESALIFILDFFHNLTNSYELSLILLSAFVSLVLIPFYHLTGILEKKERTIKQRLAMYKPSSHKNLKELYEQFGYYPFYSLRSLASLFIQIPILIAAYNALSHYAPLKETWLGYPDNFLAGFNIFPFVMTLINLCAVLISSVAESKERKQGIFIAMFFFALLYASPAALLVYWTFNQLFSFARYLMLYPIPKIKLPSFLNFNFIWQFLLVMTIHSLLTVFVGKSLCGGLGWGSALAVLIIYKFVAKAKIPFTIPNYKILILNISAMIFPAVLIFKSNEVYFYMADTIIYISALLLFSIALSFILSPLFSVSFIISLMFLPMAREYTHYMSDLKASFLILFIVVFIFAGSFIKQKGAVITFFFIASLYPLFAGDNANTNFKELGEKVKIPKELAKVELNDSTSIYLFMLESFPHKDYAEYFNLPNYGNLMEVFEQADFKIYDVYSMGYNTISAMSSVFNMNADFLPKYNTTTTAIYAERVNDPEFSRGFHSGYLRAAMNGNSLVNMFLQKNGYNTILNQPHHSNMQAFRGNKYYNFVYQDKSDSVANYEIRSKNQVLKNILNATLNSDLMQEQESITSHLIGMAKFVQGNSGNKIFMWGDGCSAHSSQRLGTTEKEMQRFIPIYNKCIEAIKEKIEIMANSNAIIVFMGDHGGSFMDDGYRFPKNYDFNKTDYMKFRDVFGAFMAVRWPDKEKAAKYDYDFNVAQDLFPIIFAYLSGSEIPLKYKIQNTELRLGPHKFDKGVFYPYFYEGDTK
ncbi:MAG: YidC/Oxa1 family membrane protein insertase [Fibromonadales bacterium]|nr:YidC/Oxa1 family membrane protein insertase [Fibromonadales bacterium]